MVTKVDLHWTIVMGLCYLGGFIACTLTFLWLLLRPWHYYHTQAITVEKLITFTPQEAFFEQDKNRHE